MGLVITVAILAVLTAAGVTVYIKVRRLSESLLGKSACVSTLCNHD